MRIGYHASHEQFPPSELLRLVRRAERAGFQAAMSSDHFAPWSERQGHSGFAWSWLGAAMHATALPFGVVAIPMGWRYHPAVLAQAAATLSEMFPERLWLAMGTGEYLNEHVVGDRWPSKEERRERLAEAVDVMRRLFAGETVSRDGPIRVDRATLHTRPARPPRMMAAALTEETARRAGAWADGLVTINLGADKTPRLLRAFRDGGGGGKPVFVQAHLSWAPDEDEALRHAVDQWRTNCLPAPLSQDLALPSDFDAVARLVRPEDVRRSVHVSADLDAHRRWIEALLAQGVEEVYLHNVGGNQDAFIDAFGREVLPALARRGA